MRKNKQVQSQNHYELQGFATYICFHHAMLSITSLDEIGKIMDKLTVSFPPFFGFLPTIFWFTPASSPRNSLYLKWWTRCCLCTMGKPKQMGLLDHLPSTIPTPIVALTASVRMHSQHPNLNHPWFTKISIASTAQYTGQCSRID